MKCSYHDVDAVKKVVEFRHNPDNSRIAVSFDCPECGRRVSRGYGDDEPQACVVAEFAYIRNMAQ